MNEKVAQALCDAQVVKFGSFQLASGRESPVYIDLRILPSYPKAFRVVMDEFSNLVKELDIDIVAGIETAGIPIATAVSVITEIPMVYVRRRPKGYGTQSMIEGVVSKDQRAVLIDDLITNGASKTRFIEGIRAAGAKANKVAVILDRGQGGKEALSNDGIELSSLITLKELLDYMREHSMVEKEKYEEVLGYLEENV
ncbi:MAG: orotate phosphoribosyltransferase [Candidatus Woesearchaeota archaeon]|jgi:orotate phosphoribosyltransferase|nr:orotate phosphoribosyltransferase [Candidatus Woesearchaeota archaeon]MDP7180073.1 orotate phosphoribosyltransferase [Candidatus Woesearchaeota archaeon]